MESFPGAQTCCTILLMLGLNIGFIKFNDTFIITFCFKISYLLLISKHEPVFISCQLIHHGFACKQNLTVDKYNNNNNKMQKPY